MICPNCRREVPDTSDFQQNCYFCSAPIRSECKICDKFHPTSWDKCPKYNMTFSAFTEYETQAIHKFYCHYRECFYHKVVYWSFVKAILSTAIIAILVLRFNEKPAGANDSIYLAVSFCVVILIFAIAWPAFYRREKRIFQKKFVKEELSFHPH